MKKLYITILLLAAIISSSAQNNLAKDIKQKLQNFSNKFDAPKLVKNTTSEAYALDSISYENGSVKKMTYNPKGQLLTYKSFENKDGKFYLNDMETNTYNESGMMLTQLISVYDQWSDMLLDKWKYENVYDAQGRMVSEITWFESETPNELQLDSKTEYQYNENQTIDVFQYEWESDWELDTKQIMFVKWDNGNIPTIDSIHFYLSENGSLDEMLFGGVVAFKYNALGLVSEMSMVVFDEETGEISNKSKTETSYNSNGDILKEATTYFNPDSNEWDANNSYVYEYNEANQIINQEDYVRSWQTGVIELSVKNTYEYDSDGNLTQRKVFVSDFSNVEGLFLNNIFEFKYKKINTHNIMLAPSSTGYIYNGEDFYEQEFYKNGAIDEIKHFTLDYSTESLELKKTAKYYYSEYNPASGILSKTDNSSIRVFPNPFTNELKLQIDNNDEYLLKISNSLGQVVYTSNVQTATTHDVSNLPSGMYVISFSKNGMSNANYKLIKK